MRIPDVPHVTLGKMAHKQEPQERRQEKGIRNTQPEK